MSIASLSQTLAIQHEKVRPNLPLMYQQDYTLWGMVKGRTDVEVVSSRPTRVPMELLAGGKFRVGNPDGGDLGLGSCLGKTKIKIGPLIASRTEKEPLGARWSPAGALRAPSFKTLSTHGVGVRCMLQVTCRKSHVTTEMSLNV